MSQDNVAVVRRIYEAFAKGDVPTVLSLFDPKIEWWEAENFIYADGNPYIGPEAVLTGVFMKLGEEWEGFGVSPEGLLDAGDTVVSHGYYIGTYKRNGEKVRAQFAHFFSLRDGKVARFQQYADTAQFLRATSK
jgi:ketosteroid isomerase-like protein